MSELERNEQTGDSLLDILAEVTERIAHAKSMPLSASVLVNQSELLDLLEMARAIVPQQIVAADSVLQDASAVTDQAQSDAEGIVSDARKEATNIVTQAKAQAAQLVAKDSITIAAHAEANRIVNEATQKAEHIKRGADTYSDTTLAQLAQRLADVQEQLQAMQEQIASGRKVLAERTADANTAKTANTNANGRAAHKRVRKGAQ